MPARISSASIRRPWLPLAIALLLVSLSLSLWLNLPQHLGIGPLEDGSAEQADVEIVIEVSGPVVAPRVVSVAVGAIRAQLESDPRVASVGSQRPDGGGAAGVGAAAPTLQVELADDSPRARIEAIEDFRSEIDPGPLAISIAGSESELQQARAGVGGDLWRIAVLALPFALLLFSALAGWRWALASLLSAAFGLALALGLVRLLGEAFDASLLAAVVAAPVAIAGSIEVAAALGYRAFDLPAGASRRDRLEAAVGEGARDALAWALFAALAGVAAMASDFEQASSLGIGVFAGAIGALVAGSLVGSSALAAGAELPSHRFASPAGLAQRLTGSRAPGRRIPRVGLRFLKGLVLVAILGGVALAAHLCRETLGSDFDALAPAGADGAAIACALTAGLAIVAARTAVASRIGQEAAQLGAAPPEAAATAAEASLSATFGASILLAGLGALLQITDLGAAGEFGVVLAAIVLVDAVIGRLASTVLRAG